MHGSNCLDILGLDILGIIQDASGWALDQLTLPEASHRVLKPSGSILYIDVGMSFHHNLIVRL